ncbi:hypothetical protein F0562_001485 [Nyssa sinensis]|uniref:Glucan endo-1,3-beta-D-glucosidase n=1 Tax=Nyssa sinensis TaxID=561372 RepID=A0A5J5C872_9ASTE|nr:hypothetical protein F0562_001485 [Nyssa sinensis]
MDFYYSITNKHFMAAILLLLGLLMPSLEIAGAQSIGVCNGRDGNNLPSPQAVIDLYRTSGIGRMRLYSPDPATLQAFRGSNIELILDVPNPNLQALAADASAATQWVQTNIKNYFPDVRFRYIAVGNEVDPNNGGISQYVQFVLPAMQNIYNAIVAAGLQNQIRVSTASYTGLLGISYPPSDGTFRDNLSYALFTAPGVVVRDPNNNLEYQNLFDALVDAHYAALGRAGGPNLDIVVSESGWPSEGGNAASLDNASTYYRNLINHVRGGTPRRPGRAIETYLFAMFDENLKSGAETERHFGLFSPNRQPKYQLTFN